MLWGNNVVGSNIVHSFKKYWGPIVRMLRSAIHGIVGFPTGAERHKKQ